jgi:hypothetical protein
VDRIRMSGAVTTHPRRLPVAKALQASAPPGVFDLVLDPSPDAPVSLRTAMLAWSSIPSTSTHHLVLEDDAIPVPGFFEHAKAAAAAAPDVAIAFYANWNSRNGGAVRMGTLAGARWAPAAYEYTPTVALLLPVEVGAGFAAYARKHEDGWADDVVMSRYLADIGVRTLLTVPSLVQHGELPSLSGNDFHGLRWAACRASLPSCTDLEWKAIPEGQLDVVPFFASGLAQCQIRYGVHFRSVGRARFEPRLGVDSAGCLAAFELASRSIPETMRYLRDTVAPKTVLEFWYAGYVLGVLGRRANQDRDTASLISKWTADPLVRMSVSTLGPGGLCISTAASALLEAQPYLTELGLLALRAGAESGPDRSALNTGGGVSVVVGPAEQSLAAVLADDLRDRGHRAVLASSGEPAVGPATTVVRVAPLPPPDTPVPDDGTVPDGVRRVLLLDPTGRWAGCSVTEIPANRSGLTVTRLYLGIPYGPELDGYSQLNSLVGQALRRLPMTVRRESAVPLIHAWDVAALVDRLLSTPPVRGSGRFGTVPAVSPERLTEVIREMVHPVPVVFETDPRGDEPEPESPAAFGQGAPWTVSLAEGIRTVSQWLAYEAGQRPSSWNSSACPGQADASSRSVGARR